MACMCTRPPPTFLMGLRLFLISVCSSDCGCCSGGGWISDWNHMDVHGSKLLWKLCLKVTSGGNNVMDDDNMANTHTAVQQLFQQDVIHIQKFLIKWHNHALYGSLQQLWGKALHTIFQLLMEAGSRLNIKGISIIKIRQSLDHPIFIMVSLYW